MREIRLTIVVPCYNEEIKLDKRKYISFLRENLEVTICFVNDGSTDATLSVLNEIKSECSDQVIVIDNDINQGKAESVRGGVLSVIKDSKSTHVAMLDADLATSLEETMKMTTLLSDKRSFIFASRIQRLGSNIDRKFSRFFIGRVIATLISKILNIKVYDTQCGCKIFSVEHTPHIFDKPFISKWLFDVELFYRMIIHYGRREAIDMMYEYPLDEWIDQGDSKVKKSYIFKLFIDLISIKRRYSRLESKRD